MDSNNLYLVGQWTDIIIFTGRLTWTLGEEGIIAPISMVIYGCAGVKEGAAVDEQCNKKVRRLYEWEIVEFSSVFGNSLNYEKVRIHECAGWPDWIDRIGRKLKGFPPPGKNSHNAVTLGNHCFFPVELPDHLLPANDPLAYKHDWLVHEMTHAWQYQHLGWRYLLKALKAQFREKEKAYDFEGEQGLLKSRTKGKLFKQFNPEQQGNIAQTYYVRKRRGQDAGAWEDFIEELKQS